MKLSKPSPKMVRFPGFKGSALVSFGLQVKLPNMADETSDAIVKASAEAKST